MKEQPTSSTVLSEHSPLLGGRIASLDGLRAVSILLVLLAHLSGTPGFLWGKRVFGDFGQFGVTGVRIFFVISGFLITSLLLNEQSRHGKISLKHFYIRRTLRIFPAAYSYIAAVGIACSLGLLHATPKDFWAACTYTTNYFSHNDNLGHLWSLAVEEQFYILWPLLLSLAGKRHSMLMAILMLLVAPCARMVHDYWLPGNIWLSSHSFLANADALACGCILSGLWRRLGQWQWYCRFRRSWLFLAVPLLAVACNTYWRIQDSPLGILAQNICVAMCIDWCVRNCNSPVGKLLNWKPVAYFGVLSYSIYLWQQPFINRDGTLRLFNTFPFNLLVAFLVAVAGYYLIEQPFLKLRKRLVPPER